MALFDFQITKMGQKCVLQEAIMLVNLELRLSLWLRGFGGWPGFRGLRNDF